MRQDWIGQGPFLKRGLRNTTIDQSMLSCFRCCRQPTNKEMEDFHQQQHKTRDLPSRWRHLSREICTRRGIGLLDGGNLTSTMSPNGTKAACRISSFTCSSNPPTYTFRFGFASLAILRVSYCTPTRTTERENEQREASLGGCVRSHTPCLTPAYRR